MDDIRKKIKLCRKGATRKLSYHYGYRKNSLGGGRTTSFFCEDCFNDLINDFKNYNYTDYIIERI